MGKFRMVGIDFWNDPVVVEEMTPEDRYFYLYLLTNPRTTQIGIYKITKKHMACDLGYSVESVQSLMDRFINHHQVIRYNPETREIAIKDWGANNLRRGGKPVMDCISAELREVKDLSLIAYVAENIRKGDILAVYESFCEKEVEVSFQNHETCINTEESLDEKSYDDTLATRDTIRGQKEEEKEEKEQQQDLYPNIDHTPKGERSVNLTQQDQDIKEIVEFWDQNGFGYSNVHGKDRLLMWLIDSSFLNPKEIILKAMQLACSNNKRRLNYVEGILKNWENESLLTLEEIELELKNKPKVKKQPVDKQQTGRDIPTDFVFDINAGEKE